LHSGQEARDNYILMGIEEKLREIIHHHLSVVLEYNPFERFDGISDKESFLEMIGNDPAFAPFFLDNPKYVTARIGGNLIVSLHRNLISFMKSDRRG